MRILVIGGNGFMGAQTVEKLYEEGHELVLVNRGTQYWGVDIKEKLACSSSSTSEKAKGDIKQIVLNRKAKYLRDGSQSEARALIRALEPFEAVVDFSSTSHKSLEALLEFLNIAEKVQTDS